MKITMSRLITSLSRRRTFNRLYSTSAIKIVEVGPRDGLQNEKTPISIDDKIELINRLSNSGLRMIEAASFVSPKWVPQMAGSTDIMKKINRKPGISYTALVPNSQGLKSAFESQVDEIAVFTAASEGFSHKNINCSIDDSIQRLTDVVKDALVKNVPVRGYVSCVIACPYDGRTDPSAVSKVTAKLLEMGCYEISLGDTIGIGGPGEWRNLLMTLEQDVPMSKLAVHSHDTFGQALVSVLTCLERGITVVDSSISGLGGCPYAKGSSGNLATEDLVYMLNSLGASTGVDLDVLVKISDWISNQVLRRPPTSKVARALLAKKN